MKPRDHYCQLYHSSTEDFQRPPPRRVDWRWAKVTELLRFTPAVARAFLEDEQDPGLVSAYEFRRMADSGDSRYADYPSTVGAYEIFNAADRDRIIIEGLLLCDPDHVSYADIAQATGIDISAVHAYAELFFDVRPYRDHWGWLFQTFFFNSLYDAASQRDQLHLARRIGLVYGHEVFVQFYRCDAPWGEKIKRTLGERVFEIYYKQAFLSTMVRGVSSDRDLKIIDTVITDINDTLKNGLGDDAVAQGVMAFLKAVPFTVADPSLEANLTLPAREPRAADLIQIAHKVEA